MHCIICLRYYSFHLQFASMELSVMSLVNFLDIWNTLVIALSFVILPCVSFLGQFSLVLFPPHYRLHFLASLNVWESS